MSRRVEQVARHTSLAEQAAGGMGDVETLVRLIEVGTDLMMSVFSDDVCFCLMMSDDGR